MIYIEIILVTAFVLFLLSSLVSGINELWALLLNKRGREMRRALRQAFPELEDHLMRSLYDHPLIAPTKEHPKWDSIRGVALKVINLFRTNKFHQDFLPSYIDSKVFSRALADVLVLGKQYNDVGTTYSDDERKLYTAIESLDENNYGSFEAMYITPGFQNEKIEKIWNDLNEGARNLEFEKVKKEILDYLRADMAEKTKVSKDLQGEALLSRFLVHSGTEEPTTTDFLARHSENLDDWLDKTAKWFDGYMERVTGWYKKRSQTNMFWWSLLIVVFFNFNLIDFVPELYKDQSMRDLWVERAVTFTETREAEKDQDAQKDTQKAEEAIEKSVKHIEELLELDYPTKWKDLANLPGWLLTAFAISMGAPFWYDVLTRAVNLRAAGKKKPEEEKKKDN